LEAEVNALEKAFLGRGWSFPVTTGADGELAQAEYEEDVRQAVRLILGTDPGERVMRPDFGAGLHALVFEPLTATTRALVKHRVEEALTLWEPRIDVLNVGVRFQTGVDAAVLVEVDYRVRSTNTFYNLVYPFYLVEGRPPA
jgi:phage baseplate assembly protein W